MTFSLQIPSPKFLDDSFTTQMDLITGKVFYHSKLGEYLDMLPWQVGEEIQRAIWRYKFSNQVLVIPKPLYFDWNNNSICHQPIQMYINRRLTKLQDEMAIIRENSVIFKGPKLDQEQKDDLMKQLGDRQMAKIDELKKMTPQDVLNAEYDGNNWHSRANECQQIKTHVDGIRGITPDRELKMNLKVDWWDVCHCFNKDGCMCGTKISQHRFKIPMELTTKYEFICHQVGRGFTRDFTRRLVTMDRPACDIKCCYKHKNQLENMSITEIDEYLENHLAQHGYIYKNEYWCKIRRGEEYTKDMRTKKGKDVPWEQIRMKADWKREMKMRITEEGYHTKYEAHTRAARRAETNGNELYRYKKMYFPKLSKRLDGKELSL